MTGSAGSAGGGASGEAAAAGSGAAAQDRGANHVVLDGDAAVPVLFLCEHARNELPEGYGTLGLDAADLETHWAYDPGILGVLEAAQRETRCRALMSRLSRLLVDLNREPTSHQLARPTIGTGFDGDAFRPVPANQDMSTKERLHRIRTFYRPFHDKVTEVGDELAARHGEHFLIVSFHSFTSSFGNEDRGFDVGVLYDDDGHIAKTLADLLHTAGLRARLNEPYSGLRGENFSPRIHAGILGCRHVEIELNQQTIRDAARQRETGVTIATAIRHLLTHW